MTAHALCVVHGVHDVSVAERFFNDALGMPTRDHGPGWALVDNASIGLRLVETDSVSAALDIELVGNDLPAVARELAAHEGVSSLRPLRWVSTWRQELWLRGPFGLTLRLVRDYDEDQLGIVPALPTKLQWDPKTESLIQELLRYVPVVFRRDARRFVTEGAEERALADGRVTVEQNEAIDVLVQRTPSFQLDRLRKELGVHGLEPELWAASFERGKA